MVISLKHKLIDVNSFDIEITVQSLNMYCDNPYSLNFEPNHGGLVNQSSRNNFSGITENWGDFSMPVKQSLVLDGEKGELVKASGRMEKRGGVSDKKTMAALKSHSEAERRRRERINAHFTGLRALVPNNEKVSECSLLALILISGFNSM